MLLQVLHGNTAIHHLPRLSGPGVSASAYCRARARRPLELFETLLSRIADRLGPEMHDGR